ncbi:MAG TPA: DUF6443 domain-containing protein, partial [Chitinophaga sp.]|nr:DUF6443 domain-containing protein [Chitinophaga sp.]
MKNNNQHIVIRLLLVCLMTVGISISTFSQDNSVVVPNAYGQGVPVNYIRTWDALAPQTDPNVLIGSAPTAVRQTTQYLDGLGRPIQVVVKQGSYPTGGSASDMVSAMVYDSLGREVRKYLPFAANTTGSNTSISDGLFKPNPFQQQQWFYSDANNGSPVKGQSETYYYGKTEYEASPLSRPLKTFAPGNAWVNQGRGVEAKYWINKAADSVRIWTVTDSSNTFGGYASSAIYAAGELYKTVTIDEQGNQSIEFKDKEGQIILKKVKLTATDNGSGSGHVGWLCTYYIYDGLNQLRAVVQPRGVELLMANSWNTTTLSGAILSEQCFRYEYDDLGRMIMKKVPGAGAVYMVYDIKNRSVLS